MACEDACQQVWDGSVSANPSLLYLFVHEHIENIFFYYRLVTLEYGSYLMLTNRFNNRFFVEHCQKSKPS